MTSLTQSQEQVLSYLQGLAPVGEPVGVEFAEVAKGAGTHRHVASIDLRALASAGYIERRDQTGPYREYRVLRRLEDRVIL